MLLLMLDSTSLSPLETITKMLATTRLLQLRRLLPSEPPPSQMLAHTSPTTVNALISLPPVLTSSPPGSDPSTLLTPSPELPWLLPTSAVSSLTSFLWLHPQTLTTLSPCLPPNSRNG